MELSHLRIFRNFPTAYIKITMFLKGQFHLAFLLNFLQQSISTFCDIRQHVCRIFSHVTGSFPYKVYILTSCNLIPAKIFRFRIVQINFSQATINPRMICFFGPQVNKSLIHKFTDGVMSFRIIPVICSILTILSTCCTIFIDIELSFSITE